ncbi:inositol polyphosphate 1-phosphatase [Vanessa atalanta]|uniref:inositol polyphosphate 1-phosphatase n=1 Tax=Vanessa atalanta TaxID=42275 RepID=UPI001FCCC840|nr:inositol polyphosphate 1-phosphatase [Vanessa atalanta]
MTHILKVLISASEKAARVAKSCCENSESLLVAEKCETEANTRFDKDFKTIADVLAQESAKALIVSHFPELASHVRGEECSEIGGITIGLQEDVQRTSELLSCLIPPVTAKRMSEAAHCDIDLNLDLPSSLPDLDLDNLGIWIDPIDATAEFIAGVRNEAKMGHGLPCVTVLIGAYLKSTGEPVIGIINQPFYENGKGRIIWGFNYGNVREWSKNEHDASDEKVILMSGAEKSDVIEKFKALGWLVKSVPGAGHKLMKVALGEVSAYIVSQGTTFRWDTCGPHAIILAKGGNVLSYKDFLPITYNDDKDLDSKEYCNKHGIIAYTNESFLNELKNIII